MTLDSGYLILWQVGTTARALHHSRGEDDRMGYGLQVAVDNVGDLELVSLELVVLLGVIPHEGPAVALVNCNYWQITDLEDTIARFASRVPRHVSYRSSNAMSR